MEGGARPGGMRPPMQSERGGEGAAERMADDAVEAGYIGSGAGEGPAAWTGDDAVEAGYRGLARTCTAESSGVLAGRPCAGGSWSDIGGTGGEGCLGWVLAASAGKPAKAGSAELRLRPERGNSEGSGCGALSASACGRACGRAAGNGMEAAVGEVGVVAVYALVAGCATTAVHGRPAAGGRHERHISVAAAEDEGAAALGSGAGDVARLCSPFASERARSSCGPCANWHLGPYGHLPSADQLVHSMVLYRTASLTSRLFVPRLPPALEWALLICCSSCPRLIERLRSAFGR